MLEAHDMTRPMAFALESTKIKLEGDRADTQSKIVAIYAPQLSDKPLKDLVAKKQASEDNQRRPDFGNQLGTAKLLLQIEIGDATFGLDQLKEFFSRNF